MIAGPSTAQTSKSAPAETKRDVVELSSDDGSVGDVELSDEEGAFNGFSEDEGMEDGELSSGRSFDSQTRYGLTCRCNRHGANANPL